MPGFVARCPNDHHHSTGKKSDSLQAGLAIIPSCVLYGNRRTGKYDRCVSKVQTPVVESGKTFRWIERDLHVIKRTPI